ncbi:hypothetical protein OA39_04111 [Vibrio campbellii]|nr:hypothetical protein OA39_04111 [Vibrio campbellii]CAD7824868.1 hypothetical protein ACOMICROBIO_LMKGKHOH_05350 [Vibrio sp. B1FIG11]CAE6954061.1 hypothetical protein ACOMICROBIO_LMKGKHOH_05350 [Vibrio sp. B1FIG11]
MCDIRSRFMLLLLTSNVLLTVIFVALFLLFTHQFGLDHIFY